MFYLHRPDAIFIGDEYFFFLNGGSEGVNNTAGRWRCRPSDQQLHAG